MLTDLERGEYFDMVPSRKAKPLNRNAQRKVSTLSTKRLHSLGERAG
jgi:hypothetical protein